MTSENNSTAFDLLDLENKFLDAWQTDGDHPNLRNFIKGLSQEDCEEALQALIPIDVQYRFQDGQDPTAEIYESVSEKAVEIAKELFADETPVTPVEKFATQMAVRPESDSDSWDPHISTRAPKNLITDRYRRHHKIGQGGMGAVWMAQQEKPMRRRVAIKIIGKSLDSEEALGRFAAERQALAMMNHPNIAKVLDAGYTEDDRPFFAMELVKGIPITQYCNDNQLPIEQRLGLMVKVCEAVQHAHQKGIIHRDIKPSNILVAYQEGQPVPKVIDFGLAKALEHSAKLTEETIVTEFGRVVGTVQYMSPEQANSNELDVDTRTDVYSLGVVLYQLLTDVVPLERDSITGKSLIEIVEMIRDLSVAKPSQRLADDTEHLNEVCEQRKTNPGQLIPKLEGELDWIVLKSLQRDRVDRYQTANALAADLQRFLNNEPVEARPLSRTYLLKKFVTKNRKLVLSIASVAALLLASTIFSVYSLQVATKEHDKANYRLDVLMKPIADSSVLYGRAKTASKFLTNVLKQLDDDSFDWEFAAKLRHAIGKILRENGDYKDAEKALTKAFEAREQNLGKHSPETLESLIELQIVVINRHKEEIVSSVDIEESRKLEIENALDTALNKFEWADKLLDGKSGVGQFYLQVFKALKKIGIERKALIKKAIELLREDQELMVNRFGLANAYLKEGSMPNIDKSIAMNLKLIDEWNEMAKQQEGEEKEKTLLNAAMATNNLAESFHEKAKNDHPELFKNAIENFELAFDIKVQKQRLLISHESCFNTIRNMAYCLCDASKKDQARQFLNKVHEMIENESRNLERRQYLIALDQLNKLSIDLDAKYGLALAAEQGQINGDLFTN